MKISALTCCKKKVHKTCLEKLLDNYAQCAYCKALIDPKKAFIDVVCLQQEVMSLDAEINESKSPSNKMEHMSNNCLSDTVRRGAMEKKGFIRHKVMRE